MAAETRTPCALVHTLGCKVNRYDAERICAELQELGLEIVSEKSATDRNSVDVCLVFTCSVTAESDRKSRQAIRRLVRRHPNALMVAASCYAEVRPEDLRAIPGVDLVIGTSNLDTLVAEVRNRLGLRESAASPLRGIERFHERTRAFIKVQDGCSQFCAYCQIPLTRGAPRSRGTNEVVEEVRRLVVAGHKEIVLCGIRLGAYGIDKNEPNALSELIERLDDVDGLVRFRLSSIEPNDLSPSLQQTLFSSTKFAPHLHIPAQSGSNATLQRMNRQYTTQEYKELLACLRANIPKLAVSTDILVGFPGETDQEAQETREFVEKEDFSKVHIFPFSPRPGTEAEKMRPRVPAKTIRDRKKHIEAVALEGALRLKERFLGCILEVLLEDKSYQDPVTRKAMPGGFSENYLQVVLEDGFEGIVVPNDLYCARMRKVENNMLFAEVVKDS